MRAIILSLALGAAACAAGGEIAPAPAPSPFPVERGSAPPPPAEARPGAAAPPQGMGPGGIDFGQWRSADPTTYQPAFQTQLTQRFAGKSRAEIRADLERNGFACTDGEAGFACRIETMERQCAFDWYYVEASNRPEPVAGFDIMCLGAN